MRFIEVALFEPNKHVVALADAYFFPPFQPSLVPKAKGGPVIPTKLPPRRARLICYNKRSNETSIWIVELSEVHAVTRGGHHRGKVISSQVVPDAQPPMVCSLPSHLILCYTPVLSVHLGLDNNLRLQFEILDHLQSAELSAAVEHTKIIATALKSWFFPSFSAHYNFRCCFS
jgi:hypothetical protein